MGISEADFMPIVILITYIKPRHMISEKFDVQQNAFGFKDVESLAHIIIELAQEG